MKTLRFVMAAVLMSLCTVAFAQSDAKTSDAPKSSVAPVPSEAQKSFTTMKSLGGEWEGAITTDIPEAMKAKIGADKLNPKIHISLRVTSRGNALVHEMQEPGTPLDATKYDHPVTMMYVDGDQLNLIHYCDAGNRPRMIGKASPDGKTVEFTFADITGRNQKEHMHHSVFTIVDADHHTEDWTFMEGDMPIHARADLYRINTTPATTAAK
jgi:hypothetical protein